MDVNVMRALMNVLGEAVKRQEDDAVLKDIVADGRRLAPNAINPALTSGAGRSTLNGAPGMTDGVSIENWHPPGQAVFDQLMDQQDAQNRAERLLRGGV